MLCVPLSSSTAQTNTPTRTNTPISSPFHTPTSPAGGGGGGGTHTATPTYGVDDEGCPVPLPDLNDVAPEWAAMCSRCFATATPGNPIPTQPIYTPSACIPDNSGNLTPTITPTLCTEGICPSIMALGGTGTPTLTATAPVCIGTPATLATYTPTWTRTPTATVSVTPSSTPACALHTYGHDHSYWSGGSLATGCLQFYVINTPGFVAGSHIKLTLPQDYTIGASGGNIVLSGSMLGGPTNQILVETWHNGFATGAAYVTLTGGGCTLTPGTFSIAAGTMVDEIRVYSQYQSVANRMLMQLRQLVVDLCSVPVATNTPTPTTTATATYTSTPSVINSPTPYASQCSTVIWRDDTPVVVFEPPVIVDITCYRLIPDIDQWILDYHIYILHVDLCIEWHQFPTIEILGIVIQLDWLLIIPLAWIIRRFLSF